MQILVPMAERPKRATVCTASPAELLFQRFFRMMKRNLGRQLGLMISERDVDI